MDFLRLTDWKNADYVDTLAASHAEAGDWRLRRAYRYEVGLIRQELDTTTKDFYDGNINKTEEEIDHDIEQQKIASESWEKDKKDFTKMHKAGKPLEEIYGWEANWEWLQDKEKYVLETYDVDVFLEPCEIRKRLASKEWSDDDIWQAHIDLCNEKTDEHKKEIIALEKEKQKNRLRLQVVKKLGNIPSKEDLDRLLRYEGAIERQLYKALNQLERLQRLRSGDSVPPPIEVDVDVDTGQNT